MVTRKHIGIWILCAGIGWVSILAGFYAVDIFVQYVTR